MIDPERPVSVHGFDQRIEPPVGEAWRLPEAQLARGDAWWIETPSYRIPFPVAWALRCSGDRNASPLFELLGPEGASIAVRTSRRMPSIESFQGPGHVFRDIGQLERAGWIEFEHTDGAQTWLYRHEQLHRGTTPFVVTLRAPLENASAQLPVLASIVERLVLAST